MTVPERMRQAAMYDDLGKMERLLLHTLACTWQGDEEWNFVAWSDLVDYSGMSVHALRAAANTLRELGYVDFEGKQGRKQKMLSLGPALQVQRRPRAA